MKLFDKVAIIGVGLIGGSVGLAVKKKGLAGEVIGVFRRASTLRKALRCKAVDKGVLEIASGVRDADLIILSTPVHLIPILAVEAIRHAKPGAILTDVGSTKAWITDEIEKAVPSAISFVGSHPMAGSEHAGVEFAKADLLEGAPCIVTKTRRTNEPALKAVVGFWRALGAKVGVMAPALHDKSVSMISHLPHVVAFSLAGAVPARDMAYAAEGFGDTTRVASSDPALWADIFLTNRRQIVKAGKAFTKYYTSLMKSISRGDYEQTVKMLKAAKSKRDKFVYEKKG